jgi:hypothetical protein
MAVSATAGRQVRLYGHEATSHRIAMRGGGVVANKDGRRRPGKSLQEKRDAKRAKREAHSKRERRRAALAAEQA